MGIFPHHCECGYTEEFICGWRNADDERLCPDCGQKLVRQVVQPFMNDYKPTNSRHIMPEHPVD